MKAIERFLQHFRRQREWTRNLVAAVPEKHFAWAPTPDEFSCGGLVRHVMQSEVFWRRLLVSTARGEFYDPFKLTGDVGERMERFRRPNLESSRAEKLGRTFAECLDSWRGIQETTERELAEIGDETLHTAQVHHPLSCLEAPLWEMCWVMVDHEAHHRGQLSAYLKVLGVPQPPVLFV